MFCRKCGTEINDGVVFCPKCGTRVNVEETVLSTNTEEEKEARLKLKPEFNLAYKLVTAIGTGILFCILIFFEFEELAISMEFLIFLVVFFFIYIILYLIFGKMQYDKLEYNFYSTKVEYIDGFLNKEEKTLKYKHIREVTMKQNILERFCGIGTIRIFTNASSGYASYNNRNNMRARNGIYIHCVEDVEEQYKVIKQIIDEDTPNE